MKVKAYLIPSLSFFILLLFSPVNLQAKPCQDYKEELDRARKSCQWDRIAQIEEIARKSGDSCLLELVEETRCSYFFSCQSKKLNRAYKNCDIEDILSVRDLVESELSQCPSVFNMRERVMGVKCLYYDRCDKAVLKENIQNCDQESFLGTTQTLMSGLMDDCPGYGSIVSSIGRQKKDYFDNCIKAELMDVSESCDLKNLRRIENDLKSHFSDSAGYEEISTLAMEFKCSHFDLCLASDISNAAGGCDIKEIVELEELSLSDDAGKCSFDYKVIEVSLNNAKNRYYQECAEKDIKDAYINGDREQINWILKSLTTYPNNQTKHRLLREKAKIFSEVVREKFNVGMESCDLDAIVEAEEYVLKERDLPNLQQIQEWAAMAKCNYFANCVEGDLQQSRNACNLERIMDIEALAKKIKGISGCVDVYGVIREAKCSYFHDCAGKDLEVAVKGCNEQPIIEIGALIASGVVDDCPDASKLPESVLEAKQTFFSKCTEGEIYKALDKCNLQELLDFEEDVYRKYHNDPGYENVSKVVREIKCSYIGTCMEKEIDFLAHNCQKERIKELEDVVEEKMGNCPNYGMFRATILKVKKKCTPVSTVAYPPKVSINQRNSYGKDR